MKALQVEVCWSEEDLAYRACLPREPERRALGETPDQARAALEKSLSSSLAAHEEPVPVAAPPMPPSEKGSARGGKSERLTRLEAASRQLDVAIRLFLAGSEPLAVHALATAAGEVFADRVNRWNGRATGDSLPRQDYLRRLRAARTLLRSPSGEEGVELDLSGNDVLIAQALADRLAACPSLPPSRDMALFRAWYRAARDGEALPEGPSPEPPRRRAVRPLPGQALQFSLLPEP